MKKQIVLIFLIFFSYLSQGQTIKVTGIKLHYKKGESIAFTIINKSDTSLFLSSFVLETLNSKDNEWYEQVYDILNSDCGELIGKEGFILQKDSLQKIVWDPQKVNPTCFNYKTNSGKYRLSFKYSTDITSKTIFYIEEFIISKD